MALLSLFRRVFKSLKLKTLKELIFNPEKCIFVFIILFFLEIFVNCFVINNIKYTEIDWQAYMEEVEGFVNGTTDYSRLKGGTGPLVYPAGFVYIFAGLYHLTNRGVNVRLAQYMFAGLYQLTLVSIFFIYARVKKVPPYAFFFMCCASYRVHSIYVLRLFNDPVAMVVFYAAVCMMLADRWTIACVLYSFSVSVKMNLLLFSPSILLLLLTKFPLAHTILHLSICAFVQILVGLPFLYTNPSAYMHRSFEFSRQFIFKWTVNWRMIGEELFLDRRFHLVLLACHLTVLSAFLYLYWIRKHGGMQEFLSKIFSSNPSNNKTDTHLNNTNNTTLTPPNNKTDTHLNNTNNTTLTPPNNNTTTPTTTTNNINSPPNFQSSPPQSSSTSLPQSSSTSLPLSSSTSLLSPDHIVTMLFVCNMVGMSFSRSLHYQFYVWYFHTLPHILWSTRLSSPVRLVLLGLIEMCWNTYPSTTLSSTTLLLCHLTILISIFHSICTPLQPPVINAELEEREFVEGSYSMESNLTHLNHLKRGGLKKAKKAD